MMETGPPPAGCVAADLAASRAERSAGLRAGRRSVGAVERIRGASVRPCLALSLHTADEALRRELLPRAHQDPLRDIVAAADAYGRDIGTPVQFEWTLLRGINDRDEDVDQLCDLLALCTSVCAFCLVKQKVPEF